MTATASKLETLMSVLTDEEIATVDELLRDSDVLRIQERAAKAAHAPLSLVDFGRQAWHILEPGYPYLHNWHIDAICEHLEAITRREIQNLLITICPRSGKSNWVSVLWPSWTWTFSPETRWLCSSYVDRLATRDAVRSRRLMKSPWYQERWGTVFEFSGDQNLKSRYENDRTGYRIAIGAAGAGTGEGGDIVVCDDPHNVKEVESDTVRQETVRWWREVMSTRLNDPDTGSKVVMMQRSHEADLGGAVLEQGGYEHLEITAEYDKRKTVTSLGFRDPRKKEGESFWPGRFPKRVLDKIRSEIGDYAYEAQFQQQPTARKGGLFERGWFEPVERSPREGARVRYWDKAGTEGGGKYTAGVRMSTYRGIFYIEDVVRGQWSAARREPVVRQVADADAQLFGIGAVMIWLEQEPGSGGKESAEASIRNLAGHRVEAHRPTGDKFVRATPFAASAKAGNVKYVRGHWNEAFLAEINKAGPGATYLDQMDAASGAFNKLALTEYSDQEEEQWDGLVL